MVGARPAQPTIAAMTRSASPVPRFDQGIRARWPPCNPSREGRLPAREAGFRPQSRPAWPPSGGPRRQAATLTEAVSATTSNRSGERSIRSSVDLPIEPVAPRMETFFMPGLLPVPTNVRTATGTRPSRRSRKPPCPGSQSPESLIPACRFILLSNRSPPWAAIANKGASRISARLRSVATTHAAAQQGRSGNAAPQAFDRFPGADRWRELALSKAPPGEIAADVRGPGDEEHPQQQRQALVPASVADPKQCERRQQAVDEAGGLPAHAPAADDPRTIRRTSRSRPLRPGPRSNSRPAPPPSARRRSGRRRSECG